MSSSNSSRRHTIANTIVGSNGESLLSSSSSIPSLPKKRSSYVGHQFKLVKIALGLKQQPSNTSNTTTNAITNDTTNTNVTTTNNNDDNTSSTLITNNNNNDTINSTEDSDTINTTEEEEEVKEISVSQEEIVLLRAELLIKEKLLNEYIDNVNTIKHGMSNQINQIGNLSTNITNNNNHDNSNNNDEDDLRILREELNNIRSRKEKVIDPLREEAIALNEALTETRKT